MAVRVVAFFALVFTALALVPYGAHLFALPNKIAMSKADYFVAQSVYRGWAWLALILLPAMLFNIVFAIMLRGQGASFALALAGCICMAATLAVFFIWTQPANAATQNWTVAPDWTVLRREWEYSHAVNAGLMLLSFGLMTLAALGLRR